MNAPAKPLPRCHRALRAKRVCSVCGASFHPWRKSQRVCGYSCSRREVSGSPEERFAKKIRKVGACWIWIGGRNSRGYGCISVNGRSERAHRVAYRLWKGPIPQGMIVMHGCDTPLCVNPRHLSVGTHADNAKDREARGRGWSGLRRRIERSAPTVYGRTQSEADARWRRMAGGKR